MSDVTPEAWRSAGELEEMARLRLSPAAYDYIAGGAGEELTMAANRSGFERCRLRPRVLTGVDQASTTSTVLGAQLAAPIFVSPMGGPAHLLAHPRGVAEAAAGAADAGLAYMVSAGSVPSLELPGAARICQLNPADRGLMAELVAQARDLGYLGVCLTVDVPVPALRRRNLRHQRGVPSPTAGPTQEGFANPAYFARPATWADVEWLRSICPLPLLIKGIMTAEDARIAIEVGVQGVVVSNHGGRQLDHALGTIEVLPEVAEAVEGRALLLIDGGVRTGAEVAIALALGADAVGVGRPVLWALAVSGREGVAAFLGSLIEDLARTMAFLGVASVADLGPTHVDRRHCREH
ncbi:MAG TPA: alpha-hydroxy acid oxidase [Candidatus Dormibacteraeota bacterium]|nr:alpha-hydroxy acid oxidase [Candidatus Dormibacteraeota bacterium]